MNRGSVPVRIVKEYTQPVSSSTYVFGDIEQVSHEAGFRAGSCIT